MVGPMLTTEPTGSVRALLVCPPMVIETLGLPAAVPAGTVNVTLYVPGEDAAAVTDDAVICALPSVTVTGAVTAPAALVAPRPVASSVIASPGRAGLDEETEALPFSATTAPVLPRLNNPGAYCTRVIGMLFVPICKV